MQCRAAQCSAGYISTVHCRAEQHSAVHTSERFPLYACDNHCSFPACGECSDVPTCLSSLVCAYPRHNMSYHAPSHHAMPRQPQGHCTALHCTEQQHSALSSVNKSAQAVHSCSHNSSKLPVLACDPSILLTTSTPLPCPSSLPDPACHRQRLCSHSALLPFPRRFQYPAPPS